MVTLRDFAEMSKLEADFFELLLSYRDEAEDLAKFLDNVSGEIIVHAPEKLVWSQRLRLLDLASSDEGLRKASRERIQEIAELLRKREVPLVIHPGGVSNQIIDPRPLLSHLLESVSNLEGRLWLENMPRRYHLGNELLHCNLMLRPEDFLPLIEHIDGVTLDVSHAYLSVPTGGNSAIASFFSTLKGRIRHIHLSDAAYPDKEGLPLGEGNIDLRSLPRMRNLPILLEIREGHENHGEGFRKALKQVRENDSWFRGCVP